MNIQEINQIYWAKMREIDFTGTQIPKIAETYLKHGKKTKELNKWGFNQAKDGELKIFAESEHSFEDKKRLAIIQANKQYQYLLAEAYEIMH